MKEDYAAEARVFKAFCDENRLQVLELLRGGERCACKLLDHLNISQSTLSHHMRILCDSGIVACRVEGKWSHYSLCAQGCARAKKLLNVLTAENEVKEPCEVCNP